MCHMLPINYSVTPPATTYQTKLMNNERSFSPELPDHLGVFVSPSTESTGTAHTTSASGSTAWQSAACAGHDQWLQINT